MPDAQFIPGDISGMLNGTSEGLSLMQRVQGMQIAKQRATEDAAQAEQQRQQFEILRPVMVAKAKADIVQAGVQIDGAKRAEETRAAATSMLPEARAAFDRIFTMENPDDREELGFEWIGKYGHLANLAEFKQEFDAKKDIVANMHQEAFTLRHLQATTDAQKDLIAARGKAALDVANVKKPGEKKPEIISLIEQKHTADEAGDTETSAYLDGRIKKLSYVKPETKVQLERLIGLKRKAEADGDTEGAQIYADQIKKMNTILVDPTKAVIASMITDSAGGAKPAVTPAAKPATAAPAKPSDMTDAQLNDFMFKK